MRICFIDSISTPYDGNTLKKRALGGSESAIIYLARELVKQGFNVDVYNRCISEHSSPGNYDGVNYIDNSQTNAFIIQKYDVCICSRSSHPLYPDSHWPFASKSTYKVVWLHDTHVGQEDRLEYMLYHKLLDEIWTLSDYATMFTTTNSLGESSRNFEFMKNYVWVTRNGAHKWIDYVDPNKKDINSFVYNAAAQKGLEVLLDKIWPRIKNEIPSAKLTVIGGYYNFGTAEHNYEIVNNAMSNEDNIGNDVTFTGLISQKQVAEIFANACMFLYPTQLPETFGISTLESMLYMTPVITQGYGALSETAIDHACVKLPFSTIQDRNDIVSEEERINAFVDTVVDLYRNERNELTRAQYACSIVNDPDIYSWESVALQWKQRIFKKLNAYMSKDDFRKVTKINDKINRVYNRKFVNSEVTQYYKKTNVENPIIIVSPFWNAERYISKHILSIAQQDYDNYTHVLIDDCSDDNSYEVALATIKMLPENIQDKFKLIKNKERIGCIGNQLNIFSKISDDAIVMLIDGDDWLINNNTIFNYYSELYHEGYDFTYGSSLGLSGFVQIGQDYPQDVIDSKTYSQHRFPWHIPYTHIRTFKGNLCNKLPSDAFKDEHGNLMMAGADNPLFFEQIKLSKKHCAVKEIFLIYNDKSPTNDYRINSDQQENNVRFYHGK